MIAIPNMKMLKSCNECMSECINIPLECYPDGDTVPDCPLIDIVTCGECKQLDHTKWCDLFLHYMNDDDFCSYGERRAD